MNHYLRYIGIISLVCFSFYFTESLALFMQKKDPLYETITTLSKDYEEEAINAVINDNFIIPGLNSRKVDIKKSFQNMKYLGFYQSSSLVFQESSPNITIKNYKDKIINRGNPLKNKVTLVISSSKFATFFEELGIYYTMLMKGKSTNFAGQYGFYVADDYDNYNYQIASLEKNKRDTSICFVHDDNKEFCKQKNKYQIKISLYINKNNFATLYSSIKSGSIIYLDDSISIERLKLLLEQIHFQGLEITNIEDLISESRYSLQKS